MRSSRRNIPTVIIVGVLLIAVAVALLKFDRRGDGPGPLGRLVVGVVSPLQGVVTSMGGSVRGIWDDYVGLVDVREENRTLQAQLREERQQAARAADLAAENSRLRRLLDLGDRRKDLRLRAARVVARSVSPYFRVMHIVLDVSAPGEVLAGMPVIAPGGVVGQIRSVFGGRADVLLVTDPRNAVDIVLEESRARGVAVGTGEEDRYAAKLRYLTGETRAIPGERVLTTGDDGRYPRGLVLGQVGEVGEAKSGPFLAASVLPLVDLGALDEVFVVLGQSGLVPDGSRLVNEK